MRIAIVGAGPAGAMAAVRLAQAGASVSLFDPTHPREKPCGGGFTGRALELVADCIDFASIPSVVARTANVESPASSARATVGLTDRGATAASSLVVFSRATFDLALVDAAVRAGARLIREPVVAVLRRGSSSIVRTPHAKHEVDFLLGADGAGSLVRKTFATPFRREQLSVAAGFFLHGVTASAIDITSVSEQPGYLWSFPRPDHLAIGICAPADTRTTSGELRAQSLKWISAHGLATTRLVPYSWPIPSVGFGSPDELRSAGPGWMLLGDAAGLVDPLTREGIFYALWSAQAAADALIHSSTAAASTVYEGRVRTEVFPELARAARLSRMFFTPAFSSLLVEALQSSAQVRQVFSDLVAGVQPYRGLRRRLLATRQWRLAARAIRLGMMPGFEGTMRGDSGLRPSNAL